MKNILCWLGFVVIVVSFPLVLYLLIKYQPKYTFFCTKGKWVKTLLFFGRGYGVRDYVYELEDGERLTTAEDLQNGDCPISYILKKNSKGEIFMVQ